jgi:hypothetical protein
MSHILAGDWRSFVVQNGLPAPDQTFHLNINEGSGAIEAGSTHGGATVTGKASPGNSPVHHIGIDKQTPNKKYRGYLLVNGPQLMLVGFLNRDPDMDTLTEGATPDDIANFFQQQQDVWIATKP